MLRVVMLVTGLGLVGTAVAMGASGAPQPDAGPAAQAAATLAPDAVLDRAAAPGRSPMVAGAAFLARGIADLAGGGAFALLPDWPSALPFPTVVARAAPVAEALPVDVAEATPPVEAPSGDLARQALPLAAPDPAPKAPAEVVLVHAGLPTRDGAAVATVKVNRGLP